MQAIYQSVFAPRKFWASRAGKAAVNRYGWLFIVLRWVYYSIVFAVFRDYSGSWKPFAPPPLGLSLRVYGSLQSYLSPLFGFFLMSCLAASLWGYLRLRNRHISLFKLLNLLGIAFFLPFVILQPLDILAIVTVGWASQLIIPLHSVVLIWESLAAMLIVHEMLPLNRGDIIAGSVLLMGLWIAVCAALWR